MRNASPETRIDIEVEPAFNTIEMQSLEFKFQFDSNLISEIGRLVRGTRLVVLADFNGGLDAPEARKLLNGDKKCQPLPLETDALSIRGSRIPC